MTAEEEISQIHDEIDEARRDLNQTLAAAGEKARAATSIPQQLSPQKLVRHYPIRSWFIAGAVGFFFGAEKRHRLIGAIAVMGLGLAIADSFDRYQAHAKSSHPLTSDDR
jgi:hypothetical protein